MIDVPLERVLTQPGRTIQPEAPITEAAERLRDPDVSALVVLEDETVVGIVTESDIVAFVAETLEPHPVRTVMNDEIKELLSDPDIKASNTSVVLNAVGENEQFELEVDER